MTTRVLPDTEAIVIAYLLSRSEITSKVDTRIGTQLDPTKSAELPAVRVRRISTTEPVVRHLRASNVQLEGWAQDDVTAQIALETAWALLEEDTGANTILGTWTPGANLPAGVTGGVVTGVDPGIGPRSQPDPATGTPRWLGSVIVYAHPIAE